MYRQLLVATALLGVAAVVSPSAARAAPEQAPDAITWGPCDDAGSPFECAVLAVPLDHGAGDRPDGAAGEALDLALIRYPADPAVRDGALLLNPGGPGGSGYRFALNTAAAIDREMELDRRFDIIGFDPRGTGESGRLDCLTDAEHEFINYGGELPAGSILLEVRSVGEVCRAQFGDVIHHYSTENTARDMDAIRAALGDEQISYLGASYGTYLGAVYATLFPERVRAMVLDSAVGYFHDGSTENYIDRPAAFERAFDNWAGWCAADPACAFHAADVGARWDALIDALEVEPLTAADGRAVDGYAAYSVTMDALYSRRDWAPLAVALERAEAGDAGALLAWYDAYNGRRPDGTYATSWEPNPAIRCASGIVAPTPSDPAAVLVAAQQVAPRFTRFQSPRSFDDICADWTTARATPVELAYDGDAPILVVGGYNDPATPYHLAPQLAAALGPRARVLGYSGEGHGFVLDSSCVTVAEGAVLRDLTLPAPHLTCGADPELAMPDYWATVPVPAGAGAAVDPVVNEALGYDPSRHYVETRAAGADPSSLAATYVAELAARGFTHVETADSNDGSFRLYFSLPAGAAPDGARLLVEFTGEAWMRTSSWGTFVAELIGGPTTLVSVVAIAAPMAS